jgi:hypothetical protein
MDGYKHYIRTNEAGIIIHGFSSAFLKEAGGSEEMLTGDMLLSEENSRQFTIQLLTNRGQYKYKIANGAMIERTQQELDDEWNARPPAPPTTEERLEAAEQALMAMMEAMI